MKLIIAFLLVFLFATNLYAADEIVSKEKTTGMLGAFWVHYAVVEHSLKGNKGEFKTALKLDKVNPNATQFLSDYWWSKIIRDCKLDEIVDKASKRSSGKNIEEYRQYLNEVVGKDLDNCSYEVISDNWKDINKSIINRLKVAKSEKK